MNNDEREAPRTDDLPDPTLGEDVLFLDLNYPDGLTHDENPLLDIENPLMEMKRFEHEEFEG